VWFTEERGGHFGVLDPRTGKITEYPSPIPSDLLAGLAFDRAGTLWLELNGSDGVDMIARMGADRTHSQFRTISQFRVPTNGATLHRIIVGPGGNIWFTELSTDKVGSITDH